MTFVCKYTCDKELRQKIRNQERGWDSINDLKNPKGWIEYLNDFMTEIREGQVYTDNAYKKMLMLFLRTYPYVARHLTQKEQNKENGFIV
jgi:hypothetical protein